MFLRVRAEVLRKLGILLFASGLAAAAFVFVNDQILQGFHLYVPGAFQASSLAHYTYRNANDSDFAISLNTFLGFSTVYDDAPLIGICLVVSLVGFVLWQYHALKLGDGSATRESKGAQARRNALIYVLGKAAFLYGLLAAGWTYVNGQVLQAFYVTSPSSSVNYSASVLRMIPNSMFSPCPVTYKGYCFAFDMYPNDVLAIEAFGLASIAGFILWRYWEPLLAERNATGGGRSLPGVIGIMFAFYAGMGATLIYLVIPVMNGIYPIGGGYSTAIGYPWWVERIDTRPSTCFVQGPYLRPSCEFINYSDVFLALVILAAIGTIVWYRSSSSRRSYFTQKAGRLQDMLGLRAFGHDHQRFEKHALCILGRAATDSTKKRPEQTLTDLGSGPPRSQAERVPYLLSMSPV